MPRISSTAKPHGHRHRCRVLGRRSTTRCMSIASGRGRCVSVPRRRRKATWSLDNVVSGLFADGGGGSAPRLRFPVGKQGCSPKRLDARPGIAFHRPGQRVCHRGHGRQDRVEEALRTEAGVNTIPGLHRRQSKTHEHAVSYRQRHWLPGYAEGECRRRRQRHACGL